MSQVFFQGYGWWIFKHVKAQQEFLITPLSSDYNESSYRNNFLLSGYSKGVDGIIGKSSFRMQGFFDLTRDDAFAFKQLGSDFEPDRKLLPCSTYDGTIYRSGSAFEIFDQLRPWGLRMKEEHCHFIIDKERPFKFKIQAPEVTAKAELSAGEHVNTDDTAPKIGRRQNQINTILTAISSLELDPMNIKTGRKKDIKTECLKDKTLFTEAGFEHAWDACNAKKVN